VTIANNQGVSTEYAIYRSMTSGFTPSASNLIGWSNNSTTYNDESMVSGTLGGANVATGTYYYVVAAGDWKNNLGPVSTQVSATVGGLTPGNASANETSDICYVNNNANTNGTSTLTCTTAFSVTAYGSSIYLPTNSVVQLSAGSIPGNSASGNGIAYEIDNSNGIPLAPSSTLLTYASTSQVGTNATLSGNQWVIAPGTTANFTGTVVLKNVGNANPAGLYRAYLATVSYNTTNAGSPWTSFFYFGSNIEVVPAYVELYGGSTSITPPKICPASGCNGPITVIPASTLLIGCTSTSGYSSTTDLACDGSTSVTPVTPVTATPTPVSVPVAPVAVKAVRPVDNGNNNITRGSSGVPDVLGAETFQFSLKLQEGSTGNEVTELQNFLNAAGYNVGVADGIFGSNVKAALVKFEVANNLKGMV